MRSVHGPKPKLMKWLYTGVVRPRLTYGAIVWNQAAKSNKMKKELNKINRLACLMLTPTTRSTPQATLELAYGIPPLHIYLEETATKSFVRLDKQLHTP